MSIIDNDYQTNLLFKQFAGVAAARLDDEFSFENFRSVPNIFSNDIMIEGIPSSAPIKISGSDGVDASSNWLDSSCNYANNSIEESTYYNSANPSDPDNGKTFAEIFPDSNLKFYMIVIDLPLKLANVCVVNALGTIVVPKNILFKFEISL